MTAQVLQLRSIIVPMPELPPIHYLPPLLAFDIQEIYPKWRCLSVKAVSLLSEDNVATEFTSAQLHPRVATRCRSTDDTDQSCFSGDVSP